MVTLKNERTIMDKRNEDGIEILTRNADFHPIKIIIIINTIKVARITLFSKSLI